MASLIKAWRAERLAKDVSENIDYLVRGNPSGSFFYYQKNRIASMVLKKAARIARVE